MMTLTIALDFSFPIANPVLKFLVILIIILFAPILLNKVRIPHLLGLIIAGAVIGPHGFNLMERDSSIILSGTAGLLYIMFLAGLDIDLADFRKHKNKSVVFGIYTFTIPMILGFLTGYYILQFSVLSSFLLASIFASHTLLTYPIISKFGVSKNRAVNVTIGGTLITDTLALLVLAVIVGLSQGEMSVDFWLRIGISLIVFAAIVLFVFPPLARWFFKHFQDGVSQYIFVLMIVFLGAFLAEVAGVDGIIGAFLAGISLNRLIPNTSPLMNRIGFVGNAIFIPFFLIGVGMLVDYRVFFKGFETLKIATCMTVVALLAKYLAAILTQKTFRFTADERRLIFGLSSSHVAATLAIVMVGYNVILGTNPDGTPIRLLNESVLNGTIIMILVTCTVAAFVAQKGATNMALSDNISSPDVDETEFEEKILIPVSNMDTMEELLNLSVAIKSKRSKNNLYALNIVDNNNFSGSTDTSARKILDRAAVIAAASDHRIHELLRYDLNIVNGITSAVRENRITDLILGIHEKKGLSDSFLGNLTEGILTKCNTTTLIYKSVQPLGTIKRHVILVPDKAEKEIGFPYWLIKVWNIARNTSAKLVFFASPETLFFIKKVQAKYPLPCDFNEFSDWDNLLRLSKEILPDDNVIMLLSRANRPSYDEHMNKVPTYLNKYLQSNSFILIYPMQIGVSDMETGSVDMTNPSVMDPVLKIDEIGKTLASLFQKKY